MSEDLNTKSLGEKLHSAVRNYFSERDEWERLTAGEQIDFENIALAFAASLSHDETANAVITDLRQRLQAAEERAHHFKGLADEHAMFDAETDLAFKDLDAQIADLTERAKAAEERADMWVWLAKNTNLELDHRYLDEDDDGGTWRVHSVNGGVNDREWTLVAQGRSPLEAIQSARAALKTEGA